MSINLKTLQSWAATFKEERVQTHNLEAGNFLSSETAVIVSGPATLKSGDAIDLIPIGLAQNFSVNQGKQIFTFNEIGSSKPFMIPGRTRTSANITRILFDGPSLMYVMGLSKKTSGHPVAFNNVGKNIGGPDPSKLLIDDLPSANWEPPTEVDESNATGSYVPTGKGATSSPGQFFINLRSSFFNNPSGLGVVMFDNEAEPYGGFYLEECYINGHNMSLASQSVVIMENVSLFATDIVPLDPTTFA